jgi:hypothetical protein
MRWRGWPHRGCYALVTGARTLDAAVGRGRGGGERMFKKIRERKGEATILWLTASDNACGAVSS